MSGDSFDFHEFGCATSMWSRVEARVAALTP